MHPVLKTINEAVEGTPYEESLWLVGGAVRDRLLHANREVGVGDSGPDDLDIVSTESGPDLATLLANKGLADHAPVLFERYGTAMLTIQGVQVEISTTRKDSYDGRSRKPDVRPATIEEDAHRRDFTVNALYQSLSDGSILDPVGSGLNDLGNRLLRTPLDPVATFADDPLRMFRAVRFRWKLAFRYADGLEDAIRQSVPHLKIISIERMRDEVLKMLDHPTGADALDELMSLGILPAVAPEFVPMVGCTQGKFHTMDVWLHSLQVVRNLAGAPRNLLLSGLLHDIGKPSTRKVDSRGDIRFFGHESVGAEMAGAFMRRWKFSEADIDEVQLLVRNHMRLGSAVPYTDTAARRLLRDLGDHVGSLFTLVQADQAALKSGLKIFDVEAIRATVARVQEATPIQALTSPLTGAEIMTLTGLPPGREVGKLKDGLLERVLQGEITPGDKAAASAWVLARRAGS